MGVKGQKVAHGRVIFCFGGCNFVSELFDHIQYEGPSGNRFKTEEIRKKAKKETAGEVTDGKELRSSLMSQCGLVGQVLPSQHLPRRAGMAASPARHTLVTDGPPPEWGQTRTASNRAHPAPGWVLAHAHPRPEPLWGRWPPRGRLKWLAHAVCPCNLLQLLGACTGRGDRRGHANRCFLASDSRLRETRGPGLWRAGRLCAPAVTAPRTCQW